jgi:hypothetical protein
LKTAWIFLAVLLCLLAMVSAPSAVCADESSATVTLKVNIVWKPLVFTWPATCVGFSKATLNGYLFIIRPSQPVTVDFGWDTVSHATDPSGYRNWTAPQVKSWSGPFWANIIGLNPGTIYYFRARAAVGDITRYGQEFWFITPRYYWCPWLWHWWGWIP